ncbi:hypothetical protein IU501_01100 [Nocardia otitidiscaviarum]|uniref:hypothetical protein n=1 Tax=Nocardia otitidiscaviarum TaxID=1823 RepID=UPI001894D290|nr:hypothetical protein [Nocardia otitidiscaviarum]MBF6131602.1 hypothetical protein [Nocardia otitidiscaviarum]
MGMWEDAKRQNSEQDQNDAALGRKKDAAVQQALADLNEFVAAMRQLGVPARKVSLGSLGSGLPRKMGVTGWPITPLEDWVVGEDTQLYALWDQPKARSAILGRTTVPKDLHELCGWMGVVQVGYQAALGRDQHRTDNLSDLLTNTLAAAMKGKNH